MIYKNITGTTKTFGLLGNPVKHSYSPIIHNTITNILSQDNFNSVYVPFDVTSQNLKNAIKGAHALGVAGFNVTVPHKLNVMQYLSDLHESAVKIGAVNTLKYTECGYVGYNTDIIGLTETFKQHGIALRDKTVLIFGAGGGAAAALYAVLQDQPSHIYIVNRTMQNAQSMANNKCVSILPYDQYEHLLAQQHIDLAIQATSVGLSSEDSIVKNKAFFERVAVALDIIYNPWETTFLKDAKTYGSTCINGFDMLLLQAIASYEIFHDIKLDHDLKRTIVRSLKDHFVAYA